jgi:hypothetical protein
MLQYLSNGIKNSSRRWVLTPAIALWIFGSPFGTPTPNMGIHLGVWGFMLFALPGVCDVTVGSLSWPAPLQPLALVVSPRLGLRHTHPFTWMYYLPNFPHTYLHTCITYYIPTHLHGRTTHLISHKPTYIHVLCTTYPPTHPSISYNMPTFILHNLIMKCQNKHVK